MFSSLTDKNNLTPACLCQFKELLVCDVIVCSGLGSVEVVFETLGMGDIPAFVELMSRQPKDTNRQGKRKHVQLSIQSVIIPNSVIMLS